MVKEESLALLNGDAEAGALQSRSTNVLWKRKEQLMRWDDSETNKSSSEKRIDRERKVKFQDSDIFLSACTSGDEEEVTDLLAKGADVNTATVDGLTALHQGVIDGKPRIVEFLTRQGADINAQDNEGWTPLHAAACCGNPEIVRFLVSQGVDLTITNSDKELPIDLAEDDECRQILEKEYERQGIEPEECKNLEEETMMRDVAEWLRSSVMIDRPHPRTGATALHVAAAKGYIKLINLLLQAGADVNARDKDGWTPLHGAAHWGERQACEALVENDADFAALSFAGQAPLDVSDEEILPFLQELKKNSAAKRSKLKEVSPVGVVSSDSESSIVHKRKNSVTRLSTDEKIALAKRDEADEHEELLRQRKPTTDDVIIEQQPQPPQQPSQPAAQATTTDKESTPSPVETPPVSSVPSVRSRFPAFDSVESGQTPVRPSWQLDGKRATPTFAAPLTPSPSTPSVAISHIGPPPKRPLVTPLADNTSPKADRQQRPSISPLMTAAGGSVIRSASGPVTMNPWVRNPHGFTAFLASRHQTRPPLVSRAPPLTLTTSVLGPSTTMTLGSPRAPYSPPVVPPKIQSVSTYQLRSFTPPQQPVMREESESERKAKSKQQRQARRSTQGVTREQLQDARQLADRKPSVESEGSDRSVEAKSPTMVQSGSALSPGMVWRSRTLESTQSTPAHDANQTDEDAQSTAEGDNSTMPSAVTTPSAANLRRRSQLNRPRRGTGPVSAEDIENVEREDGTHLETRGMTTAPAPVTRVTVTMRDHMTVPAPIRSSSLSTNGNLSLSGYANRYPGYSASSTASQPSERSSSLATSRVSSVSSVRSVDGEIDYKKLYEREKVENERLLKRIDDLEGQLRRQKFTETQSENGINRRVGKVLQENGSSGMVLKSTSGSSLDDQERRSFERKIAEMEDELQEVPVLRKENDTLKTENQALVRVLSKMTRQNQPHIRPWTSCALITKD